MSAADAIIYALSSRRAACARRRGGVGMNFVVIRTGLDHLLPLLLAALRFARSPAV